MQKDQQASLAFLLICLAVSFLAYAPSLGYFYFVTDGLWLEHSVKALTDLQFLFHPLEGYFRPMTKGAYALFFLLFPWNPFPLHFFQILLHGLNGFSLFALGQRLFPEVSKSAWVVASIYFLVATTHAQAVFWPAALYEPLGAFFLLLSIHFFLQLNKWGKKSYWCSLLLFFVGLLSREMVFGFLLLLPYFCRREGVKIKDSFWFYAAGLIWLVINFSFAPLSQNPHRGEFAIGLHFFHNVYLGFNEELLRLFYQPIGFYGGGSLALFLLGVVLLAASVLSGLPLVKGERPPSLRPLLFGLAWFLIFFFSFGPPASFRYTSRRLFCSIQKPLYS